MTHQHPLADVLGASVHAAGSRVGVVGDVYADPAAEYVIGLEVIGPNGRRWYLPWAAASLEGGDVVAASPLVFMPVEQVEFYVEHGARLAEGSPDGIVVGADGRLTRPASRAAVSAAGGERTGVE